MELAPIFTALGALVTAFGGLVLAVKYVIPTHKIVNSEKTDRLRFIAALEEALKQAGIPLPIDQSLPIVKPSE